MKDLYEEDRVDASVELRVVGDLRVLSPDNLSSGGDKSELRNVDLDDRSLGHHTKLLREVKGKRWKVVSKAEMNQAEGDGRDGPYTWPTEGSS